MKISLNFMIHTYSKKRKKSWGHRTRLEDMISAICQTIEILQPLINFFEKDLINTNTYLVIMRKYGILANRKPLMCIALTQTCLFHLLKHVFFGRMRGKK